MEQELLYWLGSIGMFATTLGYALAQSYWVLLAMRLIQGVCGGALWIAVYVRIVYSFPEGQGIYIALIMIVAGIATSIGPTLSGFLVEYANANVPIFIMAGLIFLLIVTCFFLSKEKNLDKKNDVGIKEIKLLLKDIGILNVFMTILIYAAHYYAFESLTPLFLSKYFTLSPKYIGLVFASITIAFSITSFIVGKISDKYPERKNEIIILGLATCVFIGPFIFLINNLWLCIGLAVIYGCGTALISVVWMPQIILIVLRKYNESLAGIISALGTIFWSVGGLIGPVVGGFIVDHTGGYVVYSIVVFISGIIVLIIYIICFLKCRNELLPPENKEEEELEYIQSQKIDEMKIEDQVHLINE